VRVTLNLGVSRERTRELVEAMKGA
jgi:hypothetical protein